MTLDYRGGLNALRKFARGTGWYSEFETLANALEENLQSEMFGSSEQVRRDRNQIVYQLNELTRQHNVPKMFSELCLNPSSLFDAPLVLTKEQAMNVVQRQEPVQAAPTSPLPRPMYGTHHRWAILVGVDDYEDVSAYGHLEACVHDVSAIYQHLRAGGFQAENIVLLPDNDREERSPKRENILATLQSIAEITEEDDLLLFYFSGHGATRDGESYLIPQNGRQVVLHDTAVSMQRVKEIMHSARARAKVVILDACHSGVHNSIKASQPMSADFIEHVFEQATGFAIYSSCQQNQLSYLWPEKNCSVFTCYLLEALQGKADQDNKGFVTVNDVNRYVTYHVKLWASQRQLVQIPLLNYLVSGDIKLVDYPQQAQPVESPAPVPAQVDPTPFQPGDEDEALLFLKESDKLEQYFGGLEALRQGHVHQELARQLESQGVKTRNKVSAVPEDLLTAYRKAPLHAVFLYTSEDVELEAYIKDHWSELDSLSADNCDIYVFVNQFRGEENGYDLMQSLAMVRGAGFDAPSELPALFFWDQQGRHEYISFGPHPDHTSIRTMLRQLFGELRQEPTIPSVKRARQRLDQNTRLHQANPPPGKKQALVPSGQEHDWQEVDVGIIIPLKEEFEVFRTVIKATYQTKVDAQSGRSFFLFQYPVSGRSKPYRCVVGFIGQMGSTQALIFTERMLALWKPQTLVMLGITAGIHEDVRLGDVICAESVDSYMDQAKGEPGDHPDTFTLHFSGQVYQCSPGLLHFLQTFQYVHREVYLQWLQASSRQLQKLLGKGLYASLTSGGRLKTVPSLIQGPLASGPVVSASTAFKNELRKRNRAFLAVEMEAGGMMNALHQTIGTRHSLVLRGVSDFGDEQKKGVEETTERALRAYAMYNATQLFRHLLAVGAFPHIEETLASEVAEAPTPVRPSIALTSYAPPARHENVAPTSDFNQLYTILATYTDDLVLREICRSVNIEYNRLNDTSHATRAFALTTQLDNEARLTDLERELRRRLPLRFPE